jgi:hypothetical protein
MTHSGRGADAAAEIITSFGQGTMSPGLLPLPDTPAYQSAWPQTIKAAEEANEPGRFTAFIGYESASNTGGNNLHRNVIFRDKARGRVWLSRIRLRIVASSNLSLATSCCGCRRHVSKESGSIPVPPFRKLRASQFKPAWSDARHDVPRHSGGNTPSNPVSC